MARSKSAARRTMSPQQYTAYKQPQFPTGGRKLHYNDTPTEHQEQSALFDWWDKQHGKKPYHDLLWATPNGGNRHIATAVKLKREGVRAGVPDITFAYPVGNYHGLYIELKRVKGGHVSDAQKKMIAHLIASGFAVSVCKGASDAIGVLTSYLAGEWQHAPKFDMPVEKSDRNEMPSSEFQRLVRGLKR